MRARWLLNLVLVAVLAGLVWMIRVDLDRARAGPTLAGAGTPEPLLIEIDRAGEPTIVLEHRPSGWRLREPWDVDADPDRVSDLLAIREAPLLRSVPSVAAALDELGLDPVTLTLRLDTTDFAVGGIDPIGDRRYVASNGLVHLIPDRFQHLLIAPPIDFVARTPIPREPEPVFATYGGVPLGAETLERIRRVRAERLEPLTGAIDGTPLELKAMDGTRIGYLVSEDGRRWSRPDLGLRWVLPEAPELSTDPTLQDPTPPAPLAEIDAVPPSTDDSEPEAIAVDPMDAPSGTIDPSEALMDPDAPLSGDLPLGPPPKVRLRPHPVSPTPPTESAPVERATDRDLPAGFGLDPFAPDPDSP